MNRKVLCMTYREHAGQLTNAPVINAEVCQGDCYAYDDVLKARDEIWTVDLLRTVMGKLIVMHSGICGNANYRLGIDLDDSYGLYVGSFLHFGALETCIASSIEGVIETLSDITGRYFASDAYKADIARDSGKGRDACAYGEDRELWGWMIRASGVDLTQLGGTVESAITLLADNGQREANLLSQPGLLAT